MNDPLRTSHAEALQVPCPECDAAPPNPCTYLPIPAADDPHLYWTRSIRVRARIDLIGKPTERPHNGRFNVAWRQKIQRAKLAQQKAATAAITRTATSPKLRAVARAHQQWDRQEWLRLTVWLRRWGHIFTEPPSITKETK